MPHVVHDRDLADKFDRVGLHHRAEALRIVDARIATLNVDTALTHRDLDKVKDDETWRLVNGETDLRSAAATYHRARIEDVPADTVRDFAAEAKRRLNGIASDGIASAGDVIVRECDQAVQDAVARVIELTPEVRSITTDTDIVHHPGAAPAWAELHTLVGVIETAWGITSGLRLNGYVPDLHEASDKEWRYRRPDLCAPDDEKVHRVRRIIEDIERGAQPCCWTADELLADVLAWHAGRGQRFEMRS